LGAAVVLTSGFLVMGLEMRRRRIAPRA